MNQGPRNAAEWKEYRAARKKQAQEYWESLSDDKKAVIKAMHRHCHAHWRHLLMHQFLSKVCGYTNMPKQDEQYQVVAERLEEFKQWCIDNGHEKELAK
jgi:hypothetical protein